MPYSKAVGHRDVWLIIGNAISLVAGLVISYLLYIVFIDGFEAVFKAPLILALVVLVALGFAARSSYLRASMLSDRSRRALLHLGLLVVLLAAISVAAGYFNPLLGGALIVLSYFVEIFIAVPLSRDLAVVDRLGSSLFIAGILVFDVSLPLILLSRIMALVGIAGGVLKIIGLMILLQRLS